MTMLVNGDAQRLKETSVAKGGAVKQMLTVCELASRSKMGVSSTG